MKSLVCIHCWSLDHEYKALFVLMANAGSCYSQLSCWQISFKSASLPNIPWGRMTLSDSRNKSRTPRVLWALPGMGLAGIMWSCAGQWGEVCSGLIRRVLAKMFTFFPLDVGASGWGRFAVPSSWRKDSFWHSGTGTSGLPSLWSYFLVELGSTLTSCLRNLNW